MKRLSACLFLMVASAAVMAAAPSPVVITSPTGVVNSTDVTISWNAPPEGADSYEVAVWDYYASGIAYDQAGLTGTSQIVTLTDNHNYAVTVTAYNADGSSQSTVNFGVCTGGVAPTEKPQFITPHYLPGEPYPNTVGNTAAANPLTVTFSWPRITGAGLYWLDVYDWSTTWGEVTGFPAYVLDPGSGTTVSYGPVTLQEGHFYIAMLAAYGPLGGSPFTDWFYFGTSSESGPPAAPTIVAPLQTFNGAVVDHWTPYLDPSNVQVTWDRVPHVLGYELGVVDLDTGAWQTGLGYYSDPTSGSTVTATIPYPLVAGHEYFIAVNAYNPWGWGAGGYAPFVPGHAPTTAVPQFTDPTPSDSSDTNGITPTFNWTTVPDTLFYWLHIYDGNNGWAELSFSPIQVYTQLGYPPYTLTGAQKLTPGGYYAAKVEPDNEQGNGTASDTIYFVVAPVPLKTTWVSPPGNVGGVDPSQITVAWTNQAHVLWWRLEVYDTYSHADVFNQVLPVSQTPLDGQGNVTYQLSLPDGIPLIGVVQGMNNSGNADNSDYAYFSVNSLTGPPPATASMNPTGSSATTTPTFQWAAVPGTGWYTVGLLQNGNPVWSTNVRGQNQIAFGTDPYTAALTQGQTYTWTVTGNNGFGSGPTASATFTCDTVPPQVVLVAPTGSNNSLAPVFNAAPISADSFELKVVDLYNLQTVFDAQVNSFPANPAVLTAGHSYQAQAKAHNGIGWGDWGPTINFSVDPNAGIGVAIHVTIRP